MRRRFRVGAVAAAVVLVLSVAGCAQGGRLVASGSDELARAASGLIRSEADEAALQAGRLLQFTSEADLAAFKATALKQADESVASVRWRTFKAQFAAPVRVTRESELCQPLVDLVFAEDQDDVIDALYGLAGEAEEFPDAEGLYEDVVDLIAIWQAHDPADPDKTTVAVATALFQDYYCAE